jgi:cytoskeletal protein CcmA (bactofilin family)
MAPGGGSLDRQLFSGGDDGLWTRSQDAGAANAWAAWQKILTSADINGNVGRLPRFTGANLGDPSSTLGNSQLFDDGTHVGIGTTTPDATSLLTVEGNTRLNGNTFSNGNMGLGLAPTANRLEVLGSSRFNGNTSVGGNLDVDLSANVDGALQVGGNASVNANLDVDQNVNVDGTLQVDGNGRVDGRLVVGNPGSVPGNHELYVNGSMIAEEVWVKLQGSWPDYVFEPSYDLKPLTEVEIYIQENKHLPGVAPAAEMAQHGLSVGDVQKVQMEKIEELFLHMIALEKRIQTLEQENAALKAGFNQPQTRK